MSTKYYKGLLKETIVDIKISGAYYQDIKSIFVEDLNDGETKKSIDVILQNLILKKLTTPKENRLYILFVLIANIEKEAESQGKISSVEIINEEPDQSQD